LFEDASAASQRFEARNKKSGTTTALDPNDIALHKKISSLVLRRLPETAIVKKTAWALYGKNNLGHLVGDIMEMTNQLVSLSPACALVQKELRVEELQEMDEGSLPLLAEVAAEQDPLVRGSALVNASTRTHLHRTTRSRWGVGAQR
jgi:hypothetical protein